MIDFTHPTCDSADYFDRYVGDAESAYYNPFLHREWVESLSYEDRLQDDEVRLY